jgi:hypothetical protein
MKQLPILFFSVLLSFAALAQNEYIIKLNPKEDTAIQNRSFYFDNVIDEREKGAGNKVVGHFGKNDKTTAVLESDLETFFLDYLKKVYPQPKTAAVPLTLRVNEFICSSTGGMLSEAQVKLDIDIIYSNTNDMISNITLTKTKQPLMGGKTFGVLIEDILAYGAGMIRLEKAREH